MMAMMQKMMNITTAITPVNKKGRIKRVKTKPKCSVTSKMHKQCTAISWFDKSVHLSPYTTICLYQTLPGGFYFVTLRTLKI